MTMTTIAWRITGGVDTHLDLHVAAALDERGALLGVESFTTTSVGYRKLLGRLESFGTVELVGVEGTGSYGAGLNTAPPCPGRRGGRARSPQPPAPPA